MLLKLTKVGFAAKGVVYLFLGILALLAASGTGGETTGQRGIIQKIAEKPMGEFALVVIAVGLAAYAFWRLLCAFANVEHEPPEAKGYAKRVSYFFGALAYGGLAWSAVKVLRGGSAGGDQTSSNAAQAMQWPGGQWLVALVGIAILIGGVYQFRDGLKEKFMRRLRSGQMSPTEKEWARRAGRAGYVARGIVFAIIGILLLLAGLRQDPGEATGLEGALDTLAAQPFGSLLLALVAVGLAAYGIYCFVEARYRAIHT